MLAKMANSIIYNMEGKELGPKELRAFYEQAPFKTLSGLIYGPTGKTLRSQMLAFGIFDKRSEKPFGKDEHAFSVMIALANE